VRLFLDANILFSAADVRSATRQLLLLALKKGCAVTSPHAWEEARRNLANKRPHLLPGLDDIKGRIEMTQAWQAHVDVEIEEKDRPILTAAVASACTHLWTSDRMHFGHLYNMTVQGVLIVSSPQLLDLIEKRG
jgi:hypothetical protein